MGSKLASVGFAVKRISFTRNKPTGEFVPELDDLRRARDALGAQRVVLVGRSFGGRMCARLAAIEPPDALVLLGHPIAPKNRPRPEDEAALKSVRCPTLIVQGEHDALGPVEALERIADRNRLIQIYVLKGVGHQFGKRQAEGLAHAVEWLIRTLGDPASG
jgi:pimeloyl-ACP methyl ester carboxylesterase